MKHKNKKNLLKKKWVPVTVVGSMFLGASLFYNSDTVLASVNSAVMTVRKATSGTEFEDKDDLFEEETVQTESQKAFKNITAKWTDNTVEEVKKEIARQKEAGLPIYVIQWGDTLSVLAEALDTSVDKLAKLNQIENDDLILTGDLLLGVLVEADNTVSNKEVSSSENRAAEKASEVKSNDKNEGNDSTLAENESADNEDKEELKKPLTPVEALEELADQKEEEEAKEEDSGNSEEENTSPLAPEIPKIPESPHNNEDVEGGLVILPEDEVELPEYIYDGETKPIEDSVQDTTTIVYTTKTPIEKSVQYIEDSSLKPEETKVVSEGKNGLVTQKYEMTFHEDDNVVNNSLGEDVVEEMDPKVIHYGLTEEIPEDVEASQGQSELTITDVKQSGKGQSNALAYFVLSDVNSRLAKQGYATNPTLNQLNVWYDGNLHDARDHNVDNDLNLLIKHTVGEKLEYKPINTKTTSKHEKNTLAAVELLQKQFSQTKTNRKLLSLFSIGVLTNNDLPAALIEMKTDSVNDLDIKQLNKDYENTVTVLVAAIQQHMKAVYGDE